MATDIERLVVQLSADFKQFQNSMDRANRAAEQGAKKIERRFATMNKKISASFSSALKGPALAIGAGLGVSQISKYADAWTEAGNKIAAASQVSGKQARSLDELNKLATATRSGLTDTVDLYAKLLRATKDVAKGEQEVALATEIVNKAFKAGGASASEQAAGVLQLSQALGSGLLQGDELRSIRENAPLLAQAIADEFKTTIGGLKQLGADGKLTVDRVFKAILDAKPQIDRAFGATSATIGDNIGLVTNALTAFVGKLSEVSGLGSEVGKFLGHDLVEAINGLSDGLERLKAGGGAAYLTKIADALNYIDDQVQKLGGGIGSATGLNKIGPTLGLADRDFANMLAGMENPVAGYAQSKAIADLRRQIAAMFVEYRRGLAALAPSKLEAFDALNEKIQKGEISATEAKEQLEALAGTDTRIGKLATAFNPLLEKLGKLSDALRDAQRAATGNAIPDDPGRGGWAMLKHNDDVAKFINDRNTDASRSDLQKQIDDRADKIVKAAEKVGIAMTEAAAKIQAAKEIASEDIARQTSASVNSAADLLKNFEGFRSKAYWDVNAYRAGFGSDTVTLADGSIEKIAKGMTVSLADANRDLVRRIGEFQDNVKKSIGADTFASFDEKQQAALTSIAYNYGSLPQRIVDAIKTGNQQTIVQAIRGLGGDNGGVNRLRRNTEADLFLGGSPSGVQKAVRGEDRFRESLEDTEKRIALLNEEAKALGLTNPLINDYGYAQTMAEIKQRLLNEAMDNGVEITPEYAKKIDDLAQRMAQADAARNQMSAGVEHLSQQMAQSAAFGKDVLGGFIQDLKDGKSATEALSNALGKVADKLLDVGLNMLFNGGGLGATPGGGPFGGLFSWLFPFAKGGIAAHGKPVPLKRFAGGGVSRSAAIFGEAGPEAAVPLPDGRRIPVELRNPSMGRGTGSQDVVRVVLQDDSGRMAGIADQRIQTHSGTIVQVAVQQSTKTVKGQLPGMIADAQSRNM